MKLKTQAVKKVFPVSTGTSFITNYCTGAMLATMCHLSVSTEAVGTSIQLDWEKEEEGTLASKGNQHQSASDIASSRSSTGLATASLLSATGNWNGNFSRQFSTASSKTPRASQQAA